MLAEAFPELHEAAPIIIVLLSPLYDWCLKSLFKNPV